MTTTLKAPAEKKPVAPKEKKPAPPPLVPLPKFKIGSVSEEKIVGTANQLCEAAGLKGVDGYYNSTGLLRFLEMCGVVKEVGYAPPASGRGKGAKLWEMPKTLTLSFE